MLVNVWQTNAHSSYKKGKISSKSCNNVLLPRISFSDLTLIKKDQDIGTQLIDGFQTEKPKNKERYFI